MIDLTPIRAHADLAAIARGYGVPLRKAGAQFTAPCPFHKEKTSSFFIHPGKQMYKCWGCSRGGDVFRFVAEMEHLDFRATVRRVAELAGYPLPDEPAWAPEQRKQHARDRVAAARLAEEAVIWRRLRLSELEAEKAACQTPGSVDFEALAVPAHEHWRLWLMGGDVLVSEYRKHRTPAVVAAIRRFETDCRRLAVLVVSAVARGKAAA